MLVLGLSFLLAACFGLPVKNEFYEEVVGPNVNGCLNQYHFVISEPNCADYQVGDLTVELMPRGKKKYHSDPQKTPYKLPALVCHMQKGAGFDFISNFKVKEMVVTTNTNKTFTNFKWGLVTYNKDCKYLSMTPWLDINVEEEKEIKVKLVVTILSPEETTKEMNFVFVGKSEWYIPYTGP